MLHDPCNRTAIRRNFQNARRALADVFNFNNDIDNRVSNLEEGDVTLGLGSGVTPFEIKTVYGTRYALATEQVWSGSGWIDGDDLYVVDSTDNLRFQLNYAVGHRGVGRQNVDYLEYTGAAGEKDLLEIIELESIARWIECELTEDMSSNQAGAQVLFYWGGYPNAFNPGTIVTVHDPLQKWVGGKDKEQNFAVWDERRGQYIIISPPPGGTTSGITLHRFTTTADKALNQATVAGTLTPGGVQTLRDTQLQWQGLTGSQGWAALMPDSGLYEILSMEGTARWIHGTLNGIGSSGMQVDGYWGAPMRLQDPGTGVNTKDPGSLFIRSLSGAQAVGAYDEKTDSWLVVEAQSKAGMIHYLDRTAIGTGPTGITTSTLGDFGGSQQDVQDPSDPQTVINPLGLWQDPPPDGTQDGIALYDAIDNKYWLVAANEMALFVQFSLTSVLTKDAFGVWSGDASVTGAFRGESPGGTITVTDALGKWRWKSPVGAKGIAVRAANAGTEAWYIVEMEQYKTHITFKLQATLETSTPFLDNTVLHTQTHLPPGAQAANIGELEPPGGSFRLYNRQSGGGTPYAFAADNGATGTAVMLDGVDKIEDFPSTAPEYLIWQIDCPNPVE
jgi:hypothetical protein